MPSIHTIRSAFTHLRQAIDLSQKRIIVIGGGADLHGRKMGGLIDTLPSKGGRYDCVVRCNKLYGTAADAGTRTDVAIVRYREWLSLYGLQPTMGYVALNGPYLGGMPPENYGDWSSEERVALRAEMGVTWPSCGALAVYWAILRGCTRANLHVIGFGYDRATGGFPPHKWNVDGQEDRNRRYNWKAENAWISANTTLL